MSKPKLTCKQIIESFNKVGGKLHIDYDKAKCEFYPPEWSMALVINKIELIPHKYMANKKIECKLDNNDETAVSIDMLLWDFSSENHIYVKYDKCDPQKDGEFIRDKYHRYQEANTTGFTITYDIANMVKHY